MSKEKQIQSLIDEWLNEPRSEKKVIDFMVEFLTGDPWWTNSHISKNARRELGRLINGPCDNF